MTPTPGRSVSIALPPFGTLGLLGLPPDPAKGFVVFAHGSGSSRFSPRNAFVARSLQQAGFATLLFDLLTEDEAAERANVFDIALLADRLDEAANWALQIAAGPGLPLGLFGASTGTAAVMVAAAARRDVCAIVSRGGRPDLAGGAILAKVSAPTLLIVGARDPEILALNETTTRQLHCESRLAVVPGATHLFEEPGALETAVALARDWFSAHLVAAGAERGHMLFKDRHDAGKKLAERLLSLKYSSPVVLALPRGGVPVGFEVARALSAPLDLVLARKIGAPSEEEFAVGAVADGETPELVTDPRLLAELDISPAYLQEAEAAALREIEQRRHAYLGDRLPVDVNGRTAIVVDDGIATGATMLAALRVTRRRKPARLVLAVPVAAKDSLERLRAEADEVVCLDAPVDLRSVGACYRQFAQLRDAEVITLLDRARSFTPTTQADSTPG